VPGMVAQWRGWPHKAGGDWGDPPHRPYVTASSPEGGDMEEVREWVAQCDGMTPAFPHSAGNGRTVQVGRTAPGYDS
jgi:hypothetical protein